MYVNTDKLKEKWACKKHYLWKDIIAILLYKVVSVFCLSWRVSRTAKPIWFWFRLKLLIGPGMVLSYFICIKNSLCWFKLFFSPFISLQIYLDIRYTAASPIIKSYYFLSVAKDLANRWTDMVLLYSKPSHRSRDSFRLLVFHLFTPSEIESPSN